LIKITDWQFATFVMGIIILAIGIHASLPLKDPPALMKQLPSSGNTVRRMLFEGWRLLPRYMKDPALLKIILMFLLIYTAGSMLLNHLVNYATDIGVDALVAAGMMSAMGIASTTGRLGMGAISDRIGTRADAAICYALMFISFALLISKAPILIWVAAILFGIGNGGSIPLIPAIMGERVNIEQLSTAIGVATMAAMMGTALGPWLGGLIFDVSGGYMPALLLAAGASIAALIIILRLPSARNK
jgi:predicted MFS family arabinose efflux permease